MASSSFIVALHRPLGFCIFDMDRPHLKNQRLESNSF